MRKIIYILCLFSFLFLTGTGINGMGRKKKGREGEKVEKLTPYEKLFKGKKVVTGKGLMTVHQVDKKVYAEFPLRLLEKDMLLASVIDRITDNGEGSVGEFVGRNVVLRFTRHDSVIQSRMSVGMKPALNSCEDPAIQKALDESSRPGVLGTYRIEAWVPDSSAVVLDLTPLFVKYTVYTSPFSVQAPNAMFGFIGRKHKLQEERTFLKGVVAFDNHIVVKCEQGFDVDYMGPFGGYLAKDVKISVISDRVLMLLPERPMMPRLSDSRVGVNYVACNDFTSSMKGVEDVYYTSRWRLEPSSPEGYRRGELVEPVRPIVMYMDTLMPEAWKKYIRSGLEEWNKAFEKIGFARVIQVRDFPKDDPGFNASDLSYSVIRYSPVNWFMAICNRITDPRTGEVLSMSVTIPDNFISGLYNDRIIATMNADPSVRRAKLTEEQMGELIRLEMANVMGRSLGLVMNGAGSSVYPVDSLRSASFTQKYGLSASIMDVVPCNYVAQPGDAEKGVRMTNKGIGVYDEYVIKWLYKPIDGVRKPADERETLDKWIKESRNNPYCEYRLFEYYGMFDPQVFVGDLGDDPMKSFELYLQNLKGALANFYQWYREDDRDLSIRQGIYGSLCSGLGGGHLLPLAAYVGGIKMIEANADEDVKKYEMVPREKQREMVHYLLNFSKDLDWLENMELIREFGPGRGSMVDAMRESILGLLYSRMERLKWCVAKFDDAYSPDEFSDDIYRFVWEGTLKNRSLTKDEMKFQTAYLAMALEASTIGKSASSLVPGGERGRGITGENKYDAVFYRMDRMRYTGQLCDRFSTSSSWERDAYELPWWIRVSGYPDSNEFYGMVLRVKDLLEQATLKSTGETRLHYDYLLYKIKKSLEKK